MNTHNGGRTGSSYNPRRDRFIASDGLSIYQVRVTDPQTNTEETYTYRATSLAEALMMAERQFAGQDDLLFAIEAEDYALARHEGIHFNEADGVIL